MANFLRKHYFLNNAYLFTNMSMESCKSVS